ncbi:hypothetical protein AaE_010879, partial [Aphanomyces astaci]
MLVGIVRSTDGASSSVRPVLDPATMLVGLDATSSPASSPPPRTRDDSSRGPMEITPHLYRLFRACVLGFHVLSLVYFVCFAYASYTDIYSSSDPSTALPASVQPTTSSGIVLLIQVITSALHLVRIKSLMTAACFHRAEYIPTKRPAAFYHRMFLWLSFHDLLVVLTHS